MVRRMIARFGVTGSTLILSGLCVLASFLLYFALALSMGTIRPIGILVSLLTPAIVAPPICVVLLRVSISLDRARQELTGIREELESKNRALESEINERRASEKRLLESEEKYRMVLRSSPTGIYIGTEKAILLANKSFADLIGAGNPDELQGMSPLSIVHPDFVEIVRERLAYVREKGQPNLPIEEKMVRLDGGVIDVEAYSVPFTYKGADAIMVVVTDISERERAAERLRILSSAIEASRATVVITDSDGAIEYANPAFARITGYTLEDALGRNPRVLKSGAHSGEFYENLWKTIAAGDVWEGEKIIVLTASALDLHPEEAGASRIDGFLSKPFRDGTLLTEIGRLLGLEYTYATEERTGEPAERKEEAGVLFERVSGDMIEMIREAAIDGDFDRVIGLASEVEPIDPGLAGKIRGLAEGFDMGRLLALIERRE